MAKKKPPPLPKVKIETRVCELSALTGEIGFQARFIAIDEIPPGVPTDWTSPCDVNSLDNLKRCMKEYVKGLVEVV